MGGAASGDIVINRLCTAELTLAGRIPWSSNATFVVALGGGPPERAIYKPRSGEQPLWDFPSGTLHLREAAAFTLSRALGWDLVPPTVVRDGPLGTGAVQAFVHHDPDEHFLAMEEPDPESVERIVAFDVVANNADRKSGHVLAEAGTGRLWCIDHGLTFHVAPKLRTVIWDLAGEQPSTLVAQDLERLAEALSNGTGPAAELARLLSPAEVAAIGVRIAELLKVGRYPDIDAERRSFPWPPV